MRRHVDDIAGRRWMEDVDWLTPWWRYLIIDDLDWFCVFFGKKVNLLKQMSVWRSWLLSKVLLWLTAQSDCSNQGMRRQISKEEEEKKIFEEGHFCRGAVCELAPLSSPSWPITSLQTLLCPSIWRMHVVTLRYSPQDWKSLIFDSRRSIISRLIWWRLRLWGSTLREEDASHLPQLRKPQSAATHPRILISTRREHYRDHYLLEDQAGYNRE